jgi:murein DD-endopeptidase MepM/ murein hydrolase activator NlpD
MRNRALPLVVTITALALIVVEAASAARYGYRTLGPHMRGKDVRVLQRDLNVLKLPTTVDGVYGKETSTAVRALEQRRGWPLDGIVQRTQARQIKAIAAKRREKKRTRQVTASGDYRFPVGDPHNFGGASARFGAPRSGHTHQGQDIIAPCDTRLYAAHAGVVKTSSFQSSAGYYLVIDGADGTDTVYMHMKKLSWAPVGTPLYPGQQIGRVGASGNASGCHLHFEHWTAPGWYVGGAPYDPLPELLSWDSYS